MALSKATFAFAIPRNSFLSFVAAHEAGLFLEKLPLGEIAVLPDTFHCIR
jgi:hypothetical protein